MIQLTDNLKISIIVVLLTSYLMYHQKPSCMFRDNGEFKSFGLQSDETPFPFFMITTVIGFTTYYGLILREGKYI